MKRLIVVVALTSSLTVGISTFLAYCYDFEQSTKENEFGIKAMVVHTPPPMACPQTPCHFSGYMLKINSKIHAFLTGYDICKGIFCVRQDNLAVFLHVTYPTSPFVYVIISGDVPWKVGDTVNIRVKASPPFNMAGNYISNPLEAKFIDLGNSQVIVD
ncbi:MAG: hypothetical protein ACREBB_04925 [Nitrosotalea sp.]